MLTELRLRLLLILRRSANSECEHEHKSFKSPRGYFVQIHGNFLRSPTFSVNARSRHVLLGDAKREKEDFDLIR